MKLLIEIEDPTPGQINIIKQLQESELCKKADQERKAKQCVNEMLRGIGFEIQDFRKTQPKSQG